MLVNYTKMVKRVLTILFLILSFLSCKYQKEKLDGFIIKGNVKHLDDNELLVIKFDNGGMEIDSIPVINNKFKYAGKVKEPYFIQLLIKEGNETKGKLTEFMIENSEITITGNSIEYDSIKVVGSKSDKILKEYLKKEESLRSKWNTLKVDYDKYVKLGDSINRKKVAEKLNYILKEERVGLLKKYVSNYSDTTIGALLPNFCTIENVLTQEDYKVLYNSLSDKIKKTDYGKGLLVKSKSIN